ncbi:hypothetical protein CBS147333_9267 [Penicillium roqueforti]|nr:hypothetical protein CBS147333_9267 [Penicillium roqueforti]KAI3262584.1 hypothetical protein CBS147308_9017 [Penicillium roqueforti]KAI3288341.1 hypothetical protein DTO003C3_5945 [Penicillium roqueforti]
MRAIAFHNPIDQCSCVEPERRILTPTPKPYLSQVEAVSTARILRWTWQRKSQSCVNEVVQNARAVLRLFVESSAVYPSTCVDSCPSLRALAISVYYIYQTDVVINF